MVRSQSIGLLLSLALAIPAASQVSAQTPNQNPAPGPAGPRAPGGGPGGGQGRAPGFAQGRAPAPAAQPGLPAPTERIGGRPIHNEAERAARWKVVAMPYSRAGLTPAEQQMIAKLADACHLMDEIYLRQSDLGGWALFHTTQNADLYRCLLYTSRCV